MTAASRARFVIGIALAAAATAAGAQSEAMPAPGAVGAVVADTASGGGAPGAAGTFFVLEKVDGRQISQSVDASRRSSFGRGAQLVVVALQRTVPAGAVTLGLRASTVYSMPVAEIFAGGRLYNAAGDVKVELEAGKRYRVNGVLDAVRREVWLEEEGTGRIVGEKIVAAVAKEDAAEFAGADRYTCCNLHYEDRWIGDSNSARLPFIAAGSRAKVVGWGRYRAFLNIEGRPISAGLDYSRGQQTREQFADRILVKEDPRLRIATFSPEARAAIAVGKVRLGMTREQVLISLGIPRADRTPDLGASRWVFFASEREEFDLDFGSDDRVVAIHAATRVRDAVWLAD
ncbi:MAG: hypothetical protein ABIO71_13080 [Caldimonas sp.]